MTDASITRPRKESPTINADIYIDATLSMTGYTADRDSRYLRLLDEVEGSLANKWRRTADIQFYKFGKSIRKIDRNEFRLARTPGFYTEPGVYETTDIDLVARRATADRVSVVITDLFQNDQDTNAMVSAIKQNVFAKGLAAAIMALPSEFAGTVYDSRVPPYRYASKKDDQSTWRPFYLLIFGDAGALEEFATSLSDLPHGDKTKILIISDRIARRYQVSMKKDPSAKFINARGQKGGGNEFYFDVRKDGTGGPLLTEIAVEPLPWSPDFRADRLEIEVQKKAARGPSHDLALVSAKGSSRLVQATLALETGDPKGQYDYDILVRSGTMGGLSAPSWVAPLSSADPRPEHEPNRTLNFDRFVDELLGAASATTPPPIARLLLHIRKL